MPNPKDLVSEKQVDKEIAAGHLQPIEAPVINPNAPRTGPVVPGNSGRDPHESGSLPPNFGLSTDLYRTDYGGSVPEDRVMPIAPAATPQINAAAQGIANHVVQEAIANLPVSAALTAGNRIEITNGTTIATTDPIVDGDVLWEVDPAYFMMREDFYPSSGQTNGAWQNNESFTSCGFALSSSGFGSADTIYMGAPPNLGQLMWTNNGTQANCATASLITAGSVVASAGQQVTGYFPLLDYPSWKCSFIFKFDTFVQGSSTAAFSTTGTSFYIGLSGDTRTSTRPSTFSRPRCYMGLRFDTDTNSPSINDSFFTLEVVNNPESSGAIVRNNTQGITFVTNVAPVAGVWHRLDIVCTAAGKVTLTLDGSSTNTLTTSMPKTLVTTISGNPAASSTNNGAVITWSPSSTAPIGNWANGTKLHVAGITDVGYTFLNGDWITTFASETAQVEFFTTASIANSNITSVFTMSAYPALTPFLTMGNDNTVVSPTLDARAIFWDFFSILWNPGINPSNVLAPSSTNPRYW